MMKRVGDADGQRKQHQEDLQRIRGFRLIDDDFMNACLDDNIEGTELILRIVMGKPDITVKRVRAQHVMKNLQGRDIWLDIDATDDVGREYDIEIQRADKGAARKRARYHSSMLDAQLLRPGDDFSALPETYIIFITENDVIGDNLPIYTVERMITNVGKPFDDGEHIIYVNGRFDGSSAIGKLMHDFRCEKPSEMYYKELAERAHYLKETEGGRDTMCKIMEELLNDEKLQTAMRMLAKGKYSIEEIAEISDLTVEQVKTLAEKVRPLSA